MSDTILEVKHLKKYFNTPKGTLHAVDGRQLHTGTRKDPGNRRRVRLWKIHHWPCDPSV